MNVIDYISVLFCGLIFGLFSVLYLFDVLF